MTNPSNQQISAWDPLDTTNTDQGMIIAAQRRVIRNILKSYTGYYDLFAELIQNALDAVERRKAEDQSGDYHPRIWIKIDIDNLSVSVSDNGCGMTFPQFKQFLGPNLSFKDGDSTRGNKGVGATYLGYGFNYLEAATKRNGEYYAGVLRGGREWVEDKTETVIRPMVEPLTHLDLLNEIDCGTTLKIKLIGTKIRPRNLSWIGANSAEEWLSILRVVTPLGGIYLCDDESPDVIAEVEVLSNGTSSVVTMDDPYYLYPHAVINRTLNLKEFLSWQQQQANRGLDVSKIPAKFRKLNGLWGEWTGEQILSSGESPIVSRLDENEQDLARELGIKLYIFLAFSTDLWDHFNDNVLKIRRGHRLLHGGLQLATKHMPQGSTLTIPMTNNIGFQNLAHVIIHFQNAEPDLGRKGFQPEIVSLAEKLSVSAVTAFRRRYNLLRKPGVAKVFGDELLINEWIKSQEDHEKASPLIVSGTGLFRPQTELPIRSEPMVEQDVVALFNQMLSSGVIRGIQLISSSQYKQYDGLYRIFMSAPWDDFVHSSENPLGISEDIFVGQKTLKTPIRVLEYKYSLDGLIEEFQSEVKAPEHVSLAIAWEIGTKWQEMFDVMSYLDHDNVHHRQVHGTTHSFTHSMTGAHAFEAIILQELVSYLNNPDAESARQNQKYIIDIEGN
ncbi:MAG: ATP-binding protein [Anaerolineales bacterium]|nr:ATP-binding protein [Anaerolineales bacterium]